MYNHIRFLDASQPSHKVCQDDVVIICGDNTVADYCYLTIGAIDKGAAVVAIGHGLDIVEDAGDSLIVYSRLEEFEVGAPIRDQLGQICRCTPDENTLRDKNGTCFICLPENGGKSFLLSKDSPIFEKETGRRVTLIF